MSFTSNQPLVSVLMTAYNREDYIAEAIGSVLASEYKNFELIITDDGSTDGTITIANQFAAADSRVMVHRNAKNLGQFENRNFAASLAKGKYIKYLDSDDKFYPFSIGYCVEMMQKNPTAEWGLLSLDKADENVFLTPGQAIFRHFFEKPFLMIGPDGSIYKKAFFDRLGGFSLKYGPANDVYTNLIAASKGSMVLLTKDFFFYRLHEGQAMNNSFGYLYNNYLVSKDAQLFLKDHLSKKQLAFVDNKNKRRFLKNVVMYFCKTFNISKTNMVLRKAGFTFKDALQGIFH